MTTWVLLRGLAREARHWNGFGAALRRRLPGSDTVVALDLPGNGRRSADASPTDVRAMVSAARGELDALRQPAPYVLVALSLGGMVALQWAAEHPDELAGCVLINSSSATCPPWQRLRPGAAWTLFGTLWSARHRERRILALTTNLRGDVRALARRWTELARTAPVSRLNALRQLLAAARFRAPDGPGAVPMLVLASEADRVVAPACSRALARRHGLPLRMHTSAGHDLPLDDPEWVIAQITAWWPGVARGA